MAYIYIFFLKNLKKLEKTGIISTKFSQRRTSLVTFGCTSTNLALTDESEPKIVKAQCFFIFEVCLQTSNYNARPQFLKFPTALLVTLEMIHLLSKTTKMCS